MLGSIHAYSCPVYQNKRVSLHPLDSGAQVPSALAAITAPLHRLLENQRRNRALRLTLTSQTDVKYNHQPPEISSSAQKRTNET